MAVTAVGLTVERLRPTPVPRTSIEVGATVVWLAGEQDLTAIAALRDVIAQIVKLAARDPYVVIDLEAVSFIGSQLASALLDAKASLGQNGRTLTLRAPTQAAYRLLVLCGLSGMVQGNTAVGELQGAPTHEPSLEAERAALRLTLDVGRMGGWQWEAATGVMSWDAQQELLHGLGPTEFDRTFDGWTSLIHADDLAAVQATLLAARADQGDFWLENRVVLSDDTIRWVQTWGRVLVAVDGAIIGMVGCSVDATDVVEARLEIERSHAALDAHARRTAELSATLQEANGAPLPDDVAVLTVRLANAGGLSQGSERSVPAAAPDRALAAAEPTGDKDAALVDALRKGSEAAFALLVGRHQAPMLRAASCYVGSRATAEDVVQETWLAVLRGVDRFDGRSTLQTWMYRILTNRAKTAGQREARSVAVADMAELGTRRSDASPGPPSPDRSNERTICRAAPSPSRQPSIDERLLAGEAMGSLVSVINQLPPAQRQVITLRGVEGWSAQEVCDGLGLSEVHQRVLLHRARSTIRTQLASRNGSAIEMPIS